MVVQSTQWETAQILLLEHPKPLPDLHVMIKPWWLLLTENKWMALKMRKKTRRIRKVASKLNKHEKSRTERFNQLDLEWSWAHDICSASTWRVCLITCECSPANALQSILAGSLNPGNWRVGLGFLLLFIMLVTPYWVPNQGGRTPLAMICSVFWFIHSKSNFHYSKSHLLHYGVSLVTQLISSFSLGDDHVNGSSNRSCVTSKVSIKSLLHAPRGNGRTKNQRQLWENRHGTLELDAKAKSAMKSCGSEFTPRKMITAGSPKNHPALKSGKSSEPNHHDFRFHVNLPGCNQVILDLMDIVNICVTKMTMALSASAINDYKKSRKLQSKLFQLNITTI